jgi:hypothetical protein
VDVEVNHGKIALKPLTKFIKRSAYHNGMFFWVRCILVNQPSVTIKDAVKNFMINHSVKDGVDDSAENLVREFHRIRKEYYDEERTKDQGSPA